MLLQKNTPCSIIYSIKNNLKEVKSMKQLYKNGLLARNGVLEKADMLVIDGKIEKIQKDIVCTCGAEVIDVNDKIILPKLFDEHTHGSTGYDFNLATEDEMRILMEFYKKQQVGTVFPTLLTDEIEVLENQIKLIVKVAKDYPEIKGIHLEGPFLSTPYKGAMPEHLLQNPNIETLTRLQNTAGGLVKLMTLSPELDGAVEFIKEAVKIGVTINLGHSGATYAETMACVEAGATGFTHLFNAMRPIHHHEIWVSGAALLSDNYCETILDGLHICKEAVQLIIKTKGIDKVIAITDSIMAAGLGDGMYKLGVNDVVVKDGDARLLIGDARAGSTLCAIDGLKNLVKFSGLPVEVAIKMMTENPAKHNNMFDITGSLDEGKLAEFFIFE